MKKTQKCQIDLLVRIWDIFSNQVKWHYWDSNFISTATGIFLGNIKNIDESKKIHVLMDEPSTTGSITIF